MSYLRLTDYTKKTKIGLAVLKELCHKHRATLILYIKIHINPLKHKRELAVQYLIVCFVSFLRISNYC